MSLFPRGAFINDPQSTFPSVFRLLDEFNEMSRMDHSSQRALKTFNPKFDVKETKDAYELHGELPGIEQKDVEIEFTDTHTLTIKGRSERSYVKGNPPSGFIEGEVKNQGAIEGADGGHHNHAVAHKATVEDTVDASEKENEGAVQVKKNEKPEESEEKFWVSERSVGEFTRSFSFPVRVDETEVKANMKNGILSIFVPKAKKHEGRKIHIH